MSSEAKTQAIARVDPQVLLQRAVENNASIETLERLVALAKDVREVQAKEAWHHAMAEFQRRVPPIKKDSTATVTTMRGQYKYSYAQLGDILEIIRPILGELGLTVTWDTAMEGNRITVSCKISHELGHTETSGKVSMPLPDDADRGGSNPLQKVGSAMTYARRYSLLCVTGLCPEDDDDARGTEKQVNQVNFGPKKTESPAAPRQGGEDWQMPSKMPDAPSEKVAHPPAGDPSPQPDGHAIAVEEWVGELKAADSPEKLTALWKSLTKKDVWQRFSEQERTLFIATKDKRKGELDPPLTLA